MIDDEKIRQRAYELWELDGRRDGAEQDHWRQAREQLEAESQPAGSNNLDSAGVNGQSGIAEMPVRQAPGE